MKKNLQDSFQEAMQRAWTEAVSSLQGFEEEVLRRFQRAADHVELQQSKEDVQRLASDLGKWLQKHSDLMERRLQDRLYNIFSKVRAPLMEEIHLT